MLRPSVKGGSCRESNRSVWHISGHVNTCPVAGVIGQRVVVNLTAVHKQVTFCHKPKSSGAPLRAFRCPRAVPASTYASPGGLCDRARPRAAAPAAWTAARSFSQQHTVPPVASSRRRRSTCWASIADPKLLLPETQHPLGRAKHSVRAVPGGATAGIDGMDVQPLPLRDPETLSYQE